MLVGYTSQRGRFAHKIVDTTTTTYGPNNEQQSTIWTGACGKQGWYAAPHDTTTRHPLCPRCFPFPLTPCAPSAPPS
jgi:hypothetical protein